MLPLTDLQLYALAAALALQASGSVIARPDVRGLIFLFVIGLLALAIRKFAEGFGERFGENLADWLFGKKDNGQKRD